ncbi:hypothetical protein K3759_07670 [Sulfitobacter sp. W027]|uniref:hypothetical protein n=1 Tax=Sulfitobacter sp. W027 TaxID=2867025 RepID=UPI0021A711DF|nr:hypothetical protein [Sulfitobacter sp. W027]UWR34958.1 hypothetical protein K3759_07670 [Sulfitobacter sp. W027]
MSMEKKPRVVMARRMLSLTATTATVALTATAPAADAGIWRETSSIVLHQASATTATSSKIEGEGEGTTQAESEGEGAGTHAKGEGEGEGDAHAEGEGEGEGEADAHAEGEGEGEGEADAHAEGEGEGSSSGEGEGAGSGDSGQALQRDLSFMEGHLRAGLALYEAGDLAAAKTHMGHPIEEKYGAVADPLAERGLDRLRGQISAIAAATEAEAPAAEITAAFDAARATIEEAREGLSNKDQILGLAQLVRVAGEEYAVAVEGGSISNLHEYQDSWGFLRVVEDELRQIAETGDGAARHVAEEALEYLAETDAAFGDIQGQGEMTLDPSLLFGAAARIELEALELG